jgi:ketosteroid isomerase-like protein
MGRRDQRSEFRRLAANVCRRCQSNAARRCARPGPTAIRDFFAKRGTSVRNHKLELVEVLQMGDYAYVTSRFKASLVKGDETTILSGSTVKLYEHQSNGEWKVKSHIFVRE